MHGTLYLRRSLENARELIDWAKSVGFRTTVPAGDMHVTVVYSKTPCLWPAVRDDQIVVRSKTGRVVTPLGDGGAVVLKFENDTLQSRWAELHNEYGAQSDFPTFTPHVTISWDAADVDLNAIQAYDGPLVLGPEIMRPIDEGWKDKMVEKAKDFDESKVRREPAGRPTGGRFTDGGGGGGDLKTLMTRARTADTSSWSEDSKDELRQTMMRLEEFEDADDADLSEDELDEKNQLANRLRRALWPVYKFDKGQVFKVDESLGLVFGWGIVCKVDGEDYFDLQGDHIPEHSMLKATADFMVSSRVNKEMHVGKQQGTVVFSFPLTADIAKAMGIASKYTGWMVSVKPDNPDALAKFKDGTYTGFSIGGSRIKDKELD